MMTMFRLPIMIVGWSDNPVKRFSEQLEMWPDDIGVIKLKAILDFLNSSNKSYFFEYHLKKNMISDEEYGDYYFYNLIMTAEVATLVKMFCDTSGFRFQKGEFDDTQGIFLTPDTSQPTNH